jgi:hypothetical protein
MILKGVTFNDLLESYTELQGVQLVTKRDEEGGNENSKIETCVGDRR